MPTLRKIADAARAAATSYQSLAALTFRTFGWAACSQFGRQALQITSLIVLARLVAPENFGVMSLALVVTGFIGLLRDMGTGAAIIIQREASGEGLAPSLFSVNILLSTAGGLLSAGSAPFMARFFAAPVLEPVLQVLAGSLVVAGMGVVPQAILEREARFAQLARIELSGTATGVIAGIAMAYRGWGIWSLVAQSVVTTAITTTALIVASGARPTFHPQWRLLRSIAGYSLNLSLFNVANYLIRNADNAIIGKFLGPQELGYYALAYQIAVGPVRAIGAVVCRVLFPSMAQLQNDTAGLRREYLKAAGLMAFICFPMMALLVGLADVGTRTVLGESWEPMIPIVVVLGLVGFAQATTVTLSTIYMTTGQTGLMMRLQLALGPLGILAFWIGAQWSALAVAIGYAIWQYAGMVYPGLGIPFRLVGLRVSDLWRVSARPAIGSLAGGLIAWSIARAAEHSVGTFGALVCGALGGSLSYLLWLTTAGGLDLVERSRRRAAPNQF